MGMVNSASFAMDREFDSNSVRPHEVSTDPVNDLAGLSFGNAPRKSQIGMAGENGGVPTVHAILAILFALGEVGGSPKFHCTHPAGVPGQGQPGESDIFWTMRVVDPDAIDTRSTGDVGAYS
jgi:hypothetical protein